MVYRTYKIHAQKRYTLAIAMAVVILSSSAFAQDNTQAFTISNGVMDLSNWDIEKDGPVSLQGDWGFAWQEFLDFETISQAQLSSTIPVPSNWTHQDNAPRSSVGFGTYFLRIKLPESPIANMPPLSINSESVCCASRIEVWDENNRQNLAVSQQGQPAQSANKEISKMNLDLYTDWSPHKSSSLLVIIHVSNHVHARPGLLLTPKIERASKASIHNLKQYLINAGVVGILLIIGLYHLTLFLQRRDDKLSLTFSLLCGAFLLRSLLTSSIIEIQDFSNSLSSAQWILRLEYLSMPLIGLSGILYIQTMYPSKYTKSFLKYWGFGCGTMVCLFTFFAPTLIVTHHLNIIISQYAVSLLGIFLSVAHALYAKKNLASWMLLSFLIVVLGIINDVLYAKHLIATGYIISYCFMLFILIQSSIVARTFARAMEERDASNRALLETYLQLDKELLKHEKLIAVNDSLEKEIATASEQLIQADKMSTLGQLVAGVAHEIAGPTNYIGLAIQLITKRVESVRTTLQKILDPNDPEAVKVLGLFTKDLDEANDEVKRIGSGVDKIKGIHSALRNHGRIDPKPQPHLDIKPIIDETLIILGSKTKNIETAVNTENALPFTGRRSQLGQVLTNLIGNAADATEEVRLKRLDAGESYTPKILIQANATQRNGAEHLEISIHDNGTGIPQDIREKILEPFFTTKEVGKGTGLGMPIILRIIHGHGGDLVIEDSSELGGACLRFWIPVAPPKDTDS